MFVPFTFTDATVQFLVPGEEFQDLNPLNPNGVCDNPPCQAAALVKGKVLLGLGCYCKDPVNLPGDCQTPIRGRRHLQAGGDLTTEVDFTAPLEVTIAPEPKVGCTSFFLLCWVQAFVAFLLSFLTFGLL